MIKFSLNEVENVILDDLDDDTESIESMDPTKFSAGVVDEVMKNVIEKQNEQNPKPPSTP